MIRLTSFAGQCIAVFGLGGSGRVAARALIDGGATVFAWDDYECARELAKADDIPIVDLKSADWGLFDALVLAPGVPLTHPKPHWTVELAKASGCEIIGDIELFCRQRAAQCPGAPFVAITGTNGKSTTTALVSHLLGTLGCDVQMGGNIGKAILELEAPSMSRVHVIEISSYQIDLTPSLGPSVGILLNLSPDHLDRHGTMENYARIKERLIASSEMKVVGLDDAWTRGVVTRAGDDARVYPFTVGEGASLVPRLYAIGTTMFLHEENGVVSSSSEIASLDDALNLRGAHNMLNALAAVGAIKALSDLLNEASGSSPTGLQELCGSGSLWDLERLQEGLASFPGLAHRLEIIGDANGVLLVNDSKATNVNSAATALAAWPAGIYWIAGGLSKDGGIEALSPYFDRVRKAYLIGDAMAEFAGTLDGRVPSIKCETLEVAVRTAFDDASGGESEGSSPVVLLSPACASFDQFLNFEARGEAFRELVSKIPGVRLHGVGE